MHACGGKGRCTTCKFRVIHGITHISPPTEAEMKYLKSGQLAEDERLSCQCYPMGDVKISIPPLNRLPHIDYSD
jgi:2Fe-2S ferredoxin